MSATLGAALKKIAVALLTDRRNWEKIAVALFAVLLLFLLPILSVEAIFQRTWTGTARSWCPPSWRN